MSKVIIYSTVFHAARKALDISFNEYHLADYIFKWQSNPGAPRLGWCSKSREEMAEHVGISARGIQKMLDRLEGMNIVSIDPVTREVKATRKWFDAVVVENERLERPMKLGKPPEDQQFDDIGMGEQSSPGEIPINDGEQSSPDGVNKVHGVGEQSAGEGVNKVRNNKEGLKKSSKKRNKELAGETPPVIHKMVEVFEKKHKEHFSPDGQWAGFDWSNKEFGGLASLKKKLSKRFAERMAKDATDDEMISTFELFLTKIIETDEWFLKVFTPSGINGQFQNIINRIHNGKSNSTTTTKKPTNTRIDSSQFFSGYGGKNP